MTNEEPYQTMTFDEDGSTCVRYEPGDKWTVITSGQGHTKAHEFANEQNKFWKSWMKAAINRGHADDDDTFSRRVKR